METPEEQKKRAYLIGLRLKNSDLDTNNFILPVGLIAGGIVAALIAKKK
ncbi:MAG: hypothetical protein U0U09_00680 [Cyclobacteriaceae bacterium]